MPAQNKTQVAKKDATSKAVSDAVAPAKASAAAKAAVKPLKLHLLKIVNSTEIGNTVALYDEGLDPKFGERVGKDAATFVLKNLIGAMCYNILASQKQGVKYLADAEDQMLIAADNDASSRSEKSSDIYSQRIEWCAKMDVQQIYRKALEKEIMGLHVAFTGERYQPRVTASKTDGSHKAAEELRARREARKAASS